MKRISTRAFKTQCLKVIDEVHSKSSHVLITKNGKPFVKIIPAEDPDEVSGYMTSKVKILGDIVHGTPLKHWRSK